MLVTRKYIVELIDWKVTALENQLAELKSILSADNVEESDEKKQQYEKLHERFRKALDLEREVVLTTTPCQTQLDSWYNQYQEL